MARFRRMFRFPWRTQTQIDEEIDAELKFHLDMRTRELVDAGMRPGDARTEARRQFGSVSTATRYCRDLDRRAERYSRWSRIVDDLRQDIGYGVRKLVRSPGFAVVTVLTLALGIGANASVFTAVNTILLSELPLPAPDRIVKVYTSDFSSGPHGMSSYPDFADYRDQTSSFAALAAYTLPTPMNVGIGSEAERVFGSVVSGEFFGVLGVTPTRGRFFLPAEDQTPGTHPVAVLSHDLWQRRFAGRSDIVGQDITVNGSVFSVIGVTPRGFHGVDVMTSPDLWVTMSMLDIAIPRRAGTGILDRRGSRWLQIVGRLGDSVPVEQAQADVTTIAARLASEYPATNLGTLQNPDAPRPVTILPASTVAMGPVSESLLTRAAALLMAVVGFVLLIACANVANLLLARAGVRRREIALRQSLGAGRGRLIRQLLSESLVIALLGGAVGLTIGIWASRLFARLLPDAALRAGLTLPAFTLDARVVTFTAGVSIATGILFGLAPALQSTRAARMPSLKDGVTNPGAGARLRNGLVVAQVALSVVLLIGAGLFVRSLQTALRTDLGFVSEDVLLADLDLSLQDYDERRGQELYRSLVERVQGLPGVEAVSVARFVPVTPFGSRTAVAVDGYVPQPQEDMELNVNTVEAGYFAAMGIRFLRGRTFTPGTGARAGEVIVNDAFVQRYWPGQDPLGRRIAFGDDPARVVGVVQDGKYRSVRESALPYMYRPLASTYTPAVTLVIRAGGDPLALASAVRAVVRQLDPGLPIVGVRTLRDHVATALFGERTGALLLGGFGVIALGLAAIGIYGVVAYGVQQRAHEMGVRMALGAGHRDVLRLVIGNGMGLALVGLLVGLGAALVLTRAVTAMLFGISPTDLTTFVVAPVVLLATGLAACYLPARRATRVDPVTVLRTE